MPPIDRAHCPRFTLAVFEDKVGPDFKFLLHLVHTVIGTSRVCCNETNYRGGAHHQFNEQAAVECPSIFIWAKQFVSGNPAHTYCESLHHQQRPARWSVASYLRGFAHYLAKKSTVGKPRKSKTVAGCEVNCKLSPFRLHFLPPTFAATKARSLVSRTRHLARTSSNK